jgi:hypothetical protein
MVAKIAFKKKKKTVWGVIRVIRIRGCLKIWSAPDIGGSLEFKKHRFRFYIHMILFFFLAF